MGGRKEGREIKPRINPPPPNIPTILRRGQRGDLAKRARNSAMLGEKGVENKFRRKKKSLNFSCE